MTMLPKTSLPHGVLPVHVQARWVSSYSEEALGFVRKYGRQMELDAPETPDLLFRVGPILSEESKSTIAQLSLFIDKSGNDPKMLWSISIHPRPDSEAPQDIVENNIEFGHWNGFIQELRQLKQPQFVKYLINIHIEDSKYSCILLPRKLTSNSPDGSLLALSTEIQLEQAGYRIPDAKFGIQEFSVVYLHEENEFSVSIQAKGELNFSEPPFFPYAETAIRTVLNLGFNPLSSGA